MIKKYIPKFFKDIIKLFFFHNSYLLVKKNKEDTLKLIQKLKFNHLGHELIRVGSTDDGGYLVPNILESIDYCFSPGVGKTSDFERELKKIGISSFLIDGTIKNNLPFKKYEFDFEPLNLGVVDNKDQITLESWIKKKKLDKNKNLLLQIDIEGHEIPCILNTPKKNLEQFKIIVLEIHFMDELTSLGVICLNSFFDKLNNLFDICHIHPNNCCGVTNINGIEIPNVMEITFLRKDLSFDKKKIEKLPNPLDKKCVTYNKDIELDKFFIK